MSVRPPITYSGIIIVAGVKITIVDGRIISVI
jgi:hypothetical protein